MSEERKILETPSAESMSDRTEKDINIAAQDTALTETESKTAVQDTDKATDDIEILSVDSHEKVNVEPETVSTEVDKSIVTDQRSASLNWLLQNNELDRKNIREYLKHLSESEKQQILTELEQENSHLSKENEIYEFILSEEDAVQNALDVVKSEEHLPSQDTFLSYPTKCFFAKKKLEDIENKLESKKDGYSLELQNLNFELESLNLSLKNVKESREKFDKDIRIGGRHPVTKKIELQRIVKYFDDSIRIKMALTNLYKIQIQGDTMERSKILSQINAQEKRLASLNMTEFQEAQFEHKKSCRQLAMYKEELGKLKAKFSPLLQSLAKMKVVIKIMESPRMESLVMKSLEKEQNKMEQMKNAVSKLEHLKEVMVTEKVRNDEKVLELKASMRKIKLDPRRHNLPEVIDYAAAKRENVILMKNIKKWRKKVEASEQEKHLYLTTLSKKRI